ncbi:5052_t:CDS:2 [Diversispora eburnea]|uniref:Proline dehydrogenase n=1 Tax=Diversispora eburnea TaxID=1213867 RepID=A0A9N9BFM0_9GLOM|nr:5052_t:CDS:2 [Diversispora eburnea]
MFGRALLKNSFKNVYFNMRRKTSFVTINSVTKIDIKSPRPKSSFFSNSSFIHYRLLEEPKEFLILSKGVPRELESSREELTRELSTELSTESSRGVSPGIIPSFDEANYTFLRNKSLSELIRSLVVGKLCSIRWLVNHAEDLIKFSERLYLVQPTYWIIRKTFFAHFCGQDDIKDFEDLMNRLEKICELARERNVKILIDAEQTYFQPAIDLISIKLASKFNKSNHHDREERKRDERDEGGGGGKRDAIVFNTYQMYLKDSFTRLKRDFELSRRENFVFAAKLVRGAYMVGERLMAQKYGYPSPIHDNIEDTHKSYNEA